MRICILTQPLRANYGGVLQAYALQKALRDMGHDVTTLRFMPPVSWIPTGFEKHLLTARRFISKYIKGNKSIIYCNPDRQTRYAYREMDRFIDTHLRTLQADAPLSLQALPKFDAYIVGSDQVWRPAYSPCLPNFYLDFLGDAPVKRIAYAASFGVDRWEADQEMTGRIRPLARKFDAISVREVSGIGLCEKFLGIQAEWMPDPTLLLKAEDYLSLCGREREAAEPYIATYILDPSDEVQAFVRRISEQTGLPVINFGRIDWSICADSPEKWLSAIARASFVMTDSFHGTAFSLIFERPFLSLVNSERGASRFTSLLDAVGLRDRLVDKSQLETCQANLQNVHFEQAREAIGRFRRQGIDFLSKL